MRGPKQAGTREITVATKARFSSIRSCLKHTKPVKKKLRVPNVPNTRWRCSTARGKATVEHPTFGTRRIDVFTSRCIHNRVAKLNCFPFPDRKHSACQSYPTLTGFFNKLRKTLCIKHLRNAMRALPGFWPGAHGRLECLRFIHCHIPRE